MGRNDNIFVVRLPSKIISLSWLHITALCGGVGRAADDWQTVTSPGYPDAAYPSDARCRWTLDAQDADGRVVVEVTDLDLEAHVDCQYDFLQIMDSPMVSYVLCGKQFSGASSDLGPKQKCYFCPYYVEQRCKILHRYPLRVYLPKKNIALVR